MRGKGGLSHRHVGSVHAADAKMAIEHARDTYTRRMEASAFGCSPPRKSPRPIRAKRRRCSNRRKIKSIATDLHDPRWREAHLMDALATCALRLGDDSLILGQRLSEWCGHAPAIEVDLSLANIALDLVGQATHFLGLAGDLEGKGRDADALAFRRDVMDFTNCLLVEQKNGDFAQTVAKAIPVLILPRSAVHWRWLHPSTNALPRSPPKP